MTLSPESEENLIADAKERFVQGSNSFEEFECRISWILQGHNPWFESVPDDRDKGEVGP